MALGLMAQFAQSSLVDRDWASVQDFAVHGHALHAKAKAPQAMVGLLRHAGLAKTWALSKGIAKASAACWVRPPHTIFCR